MLPLKSCIVLLRPPILSSPVAQLIRNPQVVTLLVSGTDPNAGDLNPSVLEAATDASHVAILVRITLVYTDNNPNNWPQPDPLAFEVWRLERRAVQLSRPSR